MPCYLNTLSRRHVTPYAERDRTLKNPASKETVATSNDEGTGSRRLTGRVLNEHHGYHNVTFKKVLFSNEPDYANEIFRRSRLNTLPIGGNKGRWMV